MDQDILQIKNIIDVMDQVKQKQIRKELLTRVRESFGSFQDAYRERRERLMEINAIYRNKSYLDKNKSGWQTKVFLPFPYNAVENKTSIVHQALWGNRLSSPFSVMGQTPEDDTFAESAEAELNNTVNRIGFYGASEEAIRSTCKYGLGAYRYGWTRRVEERLWRETIRNEKNEVQRDEQGKARYRYVKRKYRINQPFVRSVDVVDHLGWDPTAKTFDPWQCDFVYEIREESKESIYEQEVRGIYEKNSFDRLKTKDPHGVLDVFSMDAKTPQIKRDEGVNSISFETPLKNRYTIIDWYGWFDIDGDGMREFIKTTVILENNHILSAEENLTGEYPIVDVQFSRSLHSLTPWGVLDPVVEMSYQINELFNQRGDSIKLKLNPQFLINVDQILEDHAYVSVPGAFHPFSAGADGDVRKSMTPLQFQNLEYIGVNEEERLINVFQQTVRVVDTQKALNSSSKDTPAATVISLMNDAQAGSSMIVNGILERHGVLGCRLLKMIQLFGDEEFVIRTAGRQGLEFKTESLENILGDYDVRVTTSTFFGNKEIELQQLIQLRPLWVDAQHIDLVEIDRSILENILPKKIDKLMKVPPKALSIMQETVLFLHGQGESVKLSPEEDLASLKMKLKAHTNFKGGKVYAHFDGQTKLEFDEHLERIQNRVDELTTQQQLQAAAAAKVQQQANPDAGPANPQGNMGNTGSPNIRTMMNQNRPGVQNAQ